MNTDDTPLAEAGYIAATADELARTTGADKAAAGVSQKVLFRRRGRIALYPDRLVLTDWSDTGDLTLTRTDITAAQTRFTKLYGRFIGGLLNAGKPLILTTTNPFAGEIYLLINRHEFMETTDDRKWEKRINDWRASQLR
ncbi:hypothetical protein AB0J86_05490 [Micromonospora sp. NPDC049559]|uniref:hypothetical protein n=1 Tax=Micromonospora sp. NPDC049559 TaxID=3155923 RepID=UPI003438EB43